VANFLLSLSGGRHKSQSPDESSEQIGAGPRGGCWIYGKLGTFYVIRQGEDAVASIGYVGQIDGKSLQETLSQILGSFQESQIRDLKKTLIGQYLLLIKKGQRIYIFSDFMGGRNIFYSENGTIISSSFSQAEEHLETGPSDLDTYKLLEFLAVKHVLYPAWLGRSTKHKRIKWLLPYEYLVVHTETSSFRLGSIVYSIGNGKQSDRSALADELLSVLRTIVGRSEYRDSTVAASLSGGRDSRLIAAIASDFYKNVRYRIAYAPGHFDSMKDMEVAMKLARIQGVSLSTYRFLPHHDENMFRELTEGFSPTFNNKLAPLLEDAGSFSLGFGGVFGTELFMPIPWNSIDEFIHFRMDGAKQALRLEDTFWETFHNSLYEEFRGIKDHFKLSDGNDQDYIRLFIMLNTARYASHILAAFNQSGYQLEPYGSYHVLDLALRVSSKLWGNHRRFGGDAKIQQVAMDNLNPRMARQLAYKSYRPMMPLSLATFPLYLRGALHQAEDLLRRRLGQSLNESSRIELPGGYYLSNGWEKYYLDRTEIKYGLFSKASSII